MLLMLMLRVFILVCPFVASEGRRKAAQRGATATATAAVAATTATTAEAPDQSAVQRAARTVAPVNSRLRVDLIVMLLRRGFGFVVECRRADAPAVVDFQSVVEAELERVRIDIDRSNRARLISVVYRSILSRA